MLNIELIEGENKAVVSVNPQIYPFDVIFTAVYCFLDEAYVLIDGDPVEEVIVELKPKEGNKIDELGKRFNNTLVKYATYKIYSARNKDIRNILLRRALLTNDDSILKEIEKDDRN